MKIENAGSGMQSTRRSTLSRRVSLSAEVDPRTLDQIDEAVTKPVALKAGDEWLANDAIASDVHVVLSGWVSRISTTRAGKRVMTQFLLPGDVTGGQAIALPGTLTALTDCEVATLSADEMRAMRRDAPQAYAVFDWSASLNNALVLDHVRSLSAFRAAQKVMHLFVTCWQRLRSAGEGHEDGFVMPLTQSQISETCGMSLVHTNKSIAKMKADGLLRIEGSRITFADPTAALRYAQWDDSVLAPFVAPKV